ncbi:hypothetical protein BC831DRAFT_205287 [Entophlyctis helioformis]|nr:hypothetical protein BC831DRAFT_205287 [Entophlyctis helioformis]
MAGRVRSVVHPNASSHTIDMGERANVPVVMGAGLPTSKSVRQIGRPGGTAATASAGSTASKVRPEASVARQSTMASKAALPLAFTAVAAWSRSDTALSSSLWLNAGTTNLPTCLDAAKSAWWCTNSGKASGTHLGSISGGRAGVSCGALVARQRVVAGQAGWHGVGVVGPSAGEAVTDKPVGLSRAKSECARFGRSRVDAPPRFGQISYEEQAVDGSSQRLCLGNRLEPALEISYWWLAKPRSLPRLAVASRHSLARSVDLRAVCGIRQDHAAATAAMCDARCLSVSPSLSL